MRAAKISAWRPILDEASSKQAVEVVTAIAAAIEKLGRTGSRTGTNANPNRVDDATLAGGTSGLAILYSYLNQADSRASRARAAEQSLRHATAMVEATAMPLSLYAGFTGVAWTMAHLQREHLLGGAHYSTVEVDLALKRLLRKPQWRADYDLISGLVGFGVYALERLPARSAAQCLEAIVDRLDERSMRRGGGTTWHTGSRLLSPLQRQACPRGYFNLGVAHGVPGVVALLGAICAAGIRRRKARRLLDGAVAWMLSQRLPSGLDSQFPAWVVPGTEPSVCRSAWCYGDPGVGAALFCAARSINEPTWERDALEIASKAARRHPEQAGVVDASLCHGAAGLGHIFNRLHQATADETFADAARFWFGRTLALRQPDRGIAGYATLTATETGTRYWHDDPGILTGAAGIALALLAASTSIAPAWDRMLLVSVRGS